MGACERCGLEVPDLPSREAGYPKDAVCAKEYINKSEGTDERHQKLSSHKPNESLMHTSKLQPIWAVMLLIITAYAVIFFSGGLDPVQHHQGSSHTKIRIKGNILRYSLPLLSSNQTVSSSKVYDERLIVAARHREDTSWLDTYIREIPHIVYQIDNPEDTRTAQSATLGNRGNEAMAYLQFIVDYYDHLPESIVFLHGHRSAWHLLDALPVLRRLRWESHGYAALRYTDSEGRVLNYACGENNDRAKFRDHVMDCEWEGLHLYPAQPSLGADHIIREDSQALQQAWTEMFGNRLGPMPSEVQSPCCSTFLVSKDRILAHSKEFYVHLRDWLLRTEMSSYMSGKMLEHTWHLIFGEPPVLSALPECHLLECENL